MGILGCGIKHANTIVSRQSPLVVANFANRVMAGTRLGHVTRARLTQIMNLLCLAPDIQEALVCMPRTVSGRDAITEKQLRPIAAMVDWRRQRRMWARRPTTAG